MPGRCWTRRGCGRYGRTWIWRCCAEHLEAFPKVAAGDPDGGPIARLSRRERFHWLVAPRSTMIQISPVHSGMCESPGEMLEELFRRLVAPARGDAIS